MRIGAFLLALFALTTSVAYAEDDAPYVPPDFLAQTPPLPPGIDAAGAWRLDLGEALQLAVKQNLGVALERQSLIAAGLNIDVARGIFEPTVAAGYSHSGARTPPVTSQEGGAGEILNSTVDDWRLSLGQRLATGMQLSLEFNNGRSNSSLKTAVSPLNYRSTVSLSVTQPLLRGFSSDLDIPRLPVLQARIGSERERRQLAVVVAEVVERTEGAYWDVLLALYRYDVQKRSYALGEAQLTLTKRQIDSGLLPPSDVISAQSTLAQRKLQLVQAEQQIQLAWDQLRAVLNLPRDQWARPILPVDVPRFEPTAISDQEALETALHHRPEVEQLDLDVQDSVLAVRKADNDKLPQIDLGVQASVVGQDTAYSGALHELGKVDGRSWSVLLNLTWTPLHRATSAAAEIERTRYEMAKTRRDQTVQQIWLGVRDAVRNLRSAALEVTAAAQFRELAEKNLEIEQRKFLNSQSSNFIVAQRQEEVAAAQLSEVAAVLGHIKSAVALARATGKLLDDRKIELKVNTP